MQVTLRPRALESDRMDPIVRLAGPRDAAGIRAIYAPIVRNTPISFEVLPPSEEEIAARVAKTLAQYPWLVCAARERVLGYAYAGGHSERAAYRWSVNVSVYVHARCRRLGVGQALYNTLFAILRLQGFVRAFAGISLPNEASVGFHESFGFRAAGTFEQVGYKKGAWHDVGYWQLTIQPGNDSPAPPQPLPILLNDGNLHEALTAGSMMVDRDVDKVVQAIDTDSLARAEGDPEPAAFTN